MPAKQLRLLPYAKPLSERFGAKFFLGLPKNPGVYLMFDGRGKLIYVGQSVNLRQRLGSYRHVHPDRSSRKLIRLVHSVERIEIEECSSGDAAKLRENALLREHRPRFNSLNTWPKAHCFIAMRCSVQKWKFSFTRQPPETIDGFYGAFKSGCLLGYVSLLRLLWTVLHQTIRLEDYPRALLSEKPPKEFSFEFNGCSSRCESAQSFQWPNLLEQFFRGESFAIAEAIQKHLPPSEMLSLFHRNYLAEDFARLEAFFLRGPVRNAELLRKNALKQNLIGQEALDDFLAVKGPVSYE